MSDSENNVECGEHGSRGGAFVCCHLVKGERLGFNYGVDPDEPDALYPDAWCDACEQVRQLEGGWNDRSKAHADVTLLCSGCYEALRERNWLQDEEHFHALLCESVEFLQPRHAAFLERFRINDHERWDWDQATGKLLFSHHGVPQVEADIGFSGSLSTESDSWMWSWANDSQDETVRTPSRKVRALGDQLGYLKLASAIWPATEEDGWEMTTIMAKTLDAIGVYRTPREHGYMYMVILNARWVAQ